MELDLSSSGIDDNALLLLSRAISSPNSVRSVNLMLNNITDAGVAALAAALRSPWGRHLEYLDLYENLVGDEGALALAQVLSENPSLKVRPTALLLNMH